VLSGQAGPAMAACDVCEGAGLEIVSFHPKTQERINGLLPPLALRTNPVDLGPAWYDSSAIGGIVRAVLEDDTVDGILLLMMFASANREAVRAVSDLLKEWNQKKPVVSCFVAPPATWDQDVQDLEDAGALINFTAPERAARTMAALWNLARLLGRV
jgi:acyl-CoA synthetase (NDP forming)